MIVEEDVTFLGNLKAATMSVPANAVGNAQVDVNNPLQATKLVPGLSARYSQGHATNATTSTGEFLHCALVAGVVYLVKAGITVASGAGPWTGIVAVDVKKNGTTILSGTITIDASTVAFTAANGTVSVTAYAAGDVFQVVPTVTAGSGTLPKGLFVEMYYRECGG